MTVLDAYVELARVKDGLEEAGLELAYDAVLSALDRLWLLLSDEERAAVNEGRS